MLPTTSIKLHHRLKTGVISYMYPLQYKILWRRLFRYCKETTLNKVKCIIKLFSFSQNIRSLVL